MYHGRAPPRALRSSNTNLPARHSGITAYFSSRAFSVSAPWNSLPACTYPLSCQIINLQTSTEVSPLPVCFCRLVTLCQRIRFVFSARCNIYISRLCYDVSAQCPSVCPSVRLSVTEVHWRIIANLGFKFRSKFTAHCRRGRGNLNNNISRYANHC